MASKTSHSTSFLNDIEAFLEETGMSASYFGKVSVNNSELVNRLRNGGDVWPRTEAKARAYMLVKRQENSKHKQRGAA